MEVAAFSDRLDSELLQLRQRLLAHHEQHVLAVYDECKILKQHFCETSLVQQDDSADSMQAITTSCTPDLENAVICTNKNSPRNKMELICISDNDTSAGQLQESHALSSKGEDSCRIPERSYEGCSFEAKASDTTLAVPPTPMSARSRISGTKSTTSFRHLNERQADKKNYGEDRIAELGRAIVEFQLRSKSAERLQLHEVTNLKDKADVLMQRLVRWNGFDHVMGVLILMNSITIGIEINADGHDSHEVTRIASTLEHIFLILYIAELCLRLRVAGRKCFNDTWVRFDMWIVFIGILSKWLLPPIFHLTHGRRPNEANTVLETVVVMRVLRLLRLVRAFRMIKQCRTAWRLVDGLLSSCWAMMSALALLALCLYVFACAGMEVMHLIINDALEHHIDLYFRSLPVTMLSLMRFVTLDSPSAIYAPIVLEQPLMLVYFVCIVLVVSIALMNLITAVLVEASIAGASKDKELQNMLRKQNCKRLAPVLRKAFHTLDSDHSGSITREEVAKASHNLPDTLLSVLEHYSVTEIFDIIDMDGTGTLEETEFVEGFIQMAMSDLDPGMMQLFALVRLQRRDIANLDLLVAEIAENLQALCSADGRRWRSSYRSQGDVGSPLSPKAVWANMARIESLANRVRSNIVRSKVAL